MLSVIQVRFSNPRNGLKNLIFKADWFQSHYYFERFGWTRKDDDRESFSGTEEDKMRVSRQGQRAVFVLIYRHITQ